MITSRTRAVFKLLSVVLGLMYLVPFAWVVLNSLKTRTQVIREPNGLVFAPTLDAYREGLADALGAILTSVQISVATTAIVLALGVPAAYALARKAGRTWASVVSVALGVLLVLQMVPQPMTVIPLYSVLASWGLLNTLAGLIVADVALLLPFAVILLRPFALAIPASMYEAAELDGAGRWQTFYSIGLPMLRNGIATVVAITFITAWGEFVYAINFLPQGVVLPVSGLLAQQNSIYSTEWNDLMALAVVTSLPLVLVFAVSQKRLVSGLSLGAMR